MAEIRERENNGLQPAKTIILAAETRSGSNYLCALMEQTGKLGYPKEYFSPHIVIDNAVTIAEQYAVAISQGKTENGVLAIKLFAHHFDRIHKENFKLSEIFPNRYWLWLRRKDLLAQAISRAIARQTNVWINNIVTDITPEYSRDEILRALKYISISDKRWHIFFTRNNISPLLLWYEDLLHSPEETIMKISIYTGIDVKSHEINSNVHTSIQRTDLNEEWKKKFLAESVCEDYLDELKLEFYHKRTFRNFWKFLNGKLERPFW